MSQTTASPQHIVILGCGSAGVSAAIYARKISRSHKITIITDEPTPEYSRCGLPYGISGEIPSLDDLVVHPASWYTSMLKADLLMDTKCTKIDTKAQSISITDLKTKKDSVLKYDKLVIATGSSPSRPPIQGAEKKQVHNCWTLADAKKIQEIAKNVQNVAIIGAGLIGMEVAEALHNLGKHVSIVEFLPDVLLAMIDADIASMIRKNVIPSDIDVYVNWAAKSINGDATPTSVSIENRETHEQKQIPAELVILATGVKPNVAIAKESGIPIGSTGGIVTNEKQETQVKNVYAAGDCAEYSSPYWKKPILTALGTVAVRQGRVAGINAAGGSAVLPPILMNRVTKLFGHEIAAVGMTSDFAEKNSVSLISLRGKDSSKPSYFPGGKPITLKLLFKSDNSILHGAQIIGEVESAQRMNALALAVGRLNAEDLGGFETCYAPPIAPTWDVINVVAEGIARRMQRTQE